MSNEPDFFRSVSERVIAVSFVDLNLHGLPMQKTLGVYWVVVSDKIRVNITKKLLTRRGMLFTISQVYDTLDVIQLFILLVRCMLQEACGRRCHGMNLCQSPLL